MIGRRLGSYRVDALLGAGGMGEVYRAHDTALGRDVAIKVLPASASDDPDRRARLLREARSAASLNHPNVCTIHEVGEVDGRAYIAMEVVEGAPLSRRLAERPLAIDEVVRFGVQLAGALAHAHDRGLVHRDFKSGNVIVTPDGRVKVLDFGLAKPLEAVEAADVSTRADVSRTEPGAIVGTVPYMAPEQLRGAAADARSDVWALGVVLHEMASGARPFTGKTGYEMSAAILNQPALLPPHVPAALAAVIRRCLEKEPGHRYQRASEVRAALEMVESTATPPVTVPAAGARRFQRLMVLGLAVAAIVIAAALWLNGGGLRDRLLGGGARQIRSLAVLPLENLSSDPEQDYFAAGIHEALITDLSQIGLDKVIAKPSADAFRKTTKSLRDIGRELAVEGLVTGSVLRANNRVQVAVQLVRADTGAVVWANRYEKNAGDVLALQNELVGAIARELRATMGPEQTVRLAKPRRVDPAAHDAYLRGRSRFSQMTASIPDRQRLDAAIAEFEKAMQIDPTYAPPHAGLATMYLAAGQTSMVPPIEVRDKAKAAALEAVGLDDGLAEAHAALGGVLLWHDWDWAAAEREIKRALDLNPDSVDALTAWETHTLLVRFKADEAESTSQRILNLDPLNPFSRIQRIWVAFFSRRFDEAIRRAQSLLEIWPGNAMSPFMMASAHASKRMSQETADDCGAALAAVGASGFNMQTTGMCAWALGVVGRTAEGRRLVQALEHAPPGIWLDPAVMSNAYGGIGDIDRAIEWARKGLDERAPNMVYMKVGAPWDAVRGDPRFQAMLREMNFPP